MKYFIVLVVVLTSVFCQAEEILNVSKVKLGASRFYALVYYNQDGRIHIKRFITGPDPVNPITVFVKDVKADGNLWVEYSKPSWGNEYPILTVIHIRDESDLD